MGPILASMTVEGLLSFGEQATLNFGQLSVLVGPNGSGKSNVIECLRIFKNSPFDIQQTFKDGGFEEWVSKYPHERVRVSTGVAPFIGNMPFVHTLQLGAASVGMVRVEESIGWEPAAHEERVFDSFRPAEPTLYPGDEQRRRSFGPGEYDRQQSVLAQLRDRQAYAEKAMLSDFYAGWRFYTEWSIGRSSILRAPAQADAPEGRLSESTDNLALALNNLQGSGAHDRIKERLSELKEGYRDFVTRVAFGQVGLALRERSFEDLVPAKRLSDGTLRFLALASILLAETPSPLIVIEEPELGMHPDMIRLVAGMIADASRKTQVIITTHSELLLTALQVDFSFLFAFDSGPQGSIVRRLSCDEFKQWRAEHDLGELWTSGELGGVRY